MAASSRESSVDCDGNFRHQQTSSEGGRSSIPMWDSSDPDRAPPPLPLNPTTTGSPTVKANTSASIAAAAKQIVERARESTPLSSYTSNQTPQASPERSLIKGAHHKRMQSLQTGSVKDLRSYLDGNRSPERSPERPSSRGTLAAFSRQNSNEALSQDPERADTPTPMARDAMKDTPTLRPSTRPPPRAILGENTPPSATMLALQTMQVPDMPFDDVTNRSGTPSAPRVHATFDFSTQLLNLTTIATGLQKEMAQLSRRSKDNATDLISLKEATNARDEDIRKSLRDLATSVNTTQGLLGPPPPPPALQSRSASTYGGSFLENKAFGSPPSGSKSFTMPRAASAHSFLDEPRCSSPSPYSVEGAASVAMLEKIIREMVTKEGQERLLSTLSELLQKSRIENVEAAKKVEQLSNFIKEKSESQALVHVQVGEEKSFHSPRDIHKAAHPAQKDSKAVANEEILKILQRIKDSVSNSGGMTSEVKGLLRDMRGEVLGTGRDLGKKLDKLLEDQLHHDLDRSISDGQGNQHAEEVQRIVEDGIADLKSHLTQMMRQRAEQDDDTFRQLAMRTGGSNGEEMLSMVQLALSEHSKKQEQQRDIETVNPVLDREGVLDAVKDGLKDFEPNIELQQFGLERDEILAVLKEGLEDYQSNRPAPAPASIDKGEVFEVIQEALKDFQAPLPIDQIALVKEELLDNVRNALAELHASPQNHQPSQEIMHAAILEAVREGLKNHGPSAPRELEISREDLFDAVKASLDGSTIPFGGLGEQVLQQLHELIEGMRVEFKQYSAANGRDTEQVLDAVKDGLESLRAEIETYVDRAQDVTGKDEIVDTVRIGLEQLRGDVQGYCLQGPSHDSGKGEMLEYIKAEFEHLHETIASQQHQETSRSLDDAKPNHVADIIFALNEGMEALKGHVETRSVAHSSDDHLIEELGEMMKVEFEQLKGAVLQAHAADKHELLETIQDSMGVLHSNLSGSELNSFSTGSSRDVVDIVQQELGTLRASINAMAEDTGKESILMDVRSIIDDLRTQLSANQGDVSAEVLAALREELDRFRDSMSSALVVGRDINEHGEVLEAIRNGLEDVKATTSGQRGNGISDEQLEAIRGEFENLRTSIASSVVHGGSNEELMDAVRIGLDDLRSHLEKKLDNPDMAMAHQSQILDALNDGLENLRGDVVKTLDKPLDMTVNYEILDTLKDGLAGLRASMDKLVSAKGRPITPQGGEIVLADAEFGGTREISPESSRPSGNDNMKRSDIEKMEVLLAQLQIKIEAMDHTIQDMPAHHLPTQAAPGSATKEDLTCIELMIKALQDSVAANASREQLGPEGAARKEDTDAIETLLRNTKAQLEDMVYPDPATVVTKEHADEIQTGLRMANDAIETIANNLESTTASKADVAVVEILVQDIKDTMAELSDKVTEATSHAEKPELMTKADLDVLGVLVTEVKTTVNEMVLPDPHNLPSKSDLEMLNVLISDFRESHDKLRDSYETDIAVTAKAFDDRKREFDDTIEQIGEIKMLVDEVKAELLEKFAEGEVGINMLGVSLKAIEENTSSAGVNAEIKEVLELVKDEFERTHGSLEAMKTDHAQATESSLEKQSEHKEALVLELSEKLDTLFAEMMTKYEEAQLAAEENAKVMADKAAEQETVLQSTREMADDLKLSIDTLGTALSAFMGDLPSTVERMAEESKTVFAQVEQTHNKLEETAESLRGEHETTRDQVAKILAAVDCVQGDLTENHPRFMVTLEEVRALIAQHYEHSQKTSEAAAEQAQTVRELKDALKAGFEDSRAQTEGLKSQHEELRTTLPVLMPPPIESSREAEKYDDSGLHEKLDRLVGHAEDTAARSTQIQRLDEIHEKVMATAAEVTAYVASQNKQITADHESKEKEAEEIGLLLERRLERKDQLEADITVLNEEKESLQHAIEGLKAEKEALMAQKARLSADCSSVETALHIRREELHEMDTKAHAIERRMVEGVMNQSRMLLLAKTNQAPAPKKKPQGRDLRITSDASSISAHTVTSPAPSNLNSGHALAMKSARPTTQRNGGTANTSERRIMSLNHLSHSHTPAVTFEKPSLATISGNGLSSMKRSQSVKTQALQRKTSWAPAKRNVSISSSTYNKENENETLSEEDDEEFSLATDSRLDGGLSDAGTEHQNRHSMAGTNEGDSMTYATGSYISDGETPGSVDDRRTSYGTYNSESGSYLTQADLDRHPSVGSSAKGTLGTMHSEGDVEERRDVLPELEPPARLHTNVAGMIKYAPPSDSGLGSDLPTAMLSGGEEEYFGRM